MRSTAPGVQAITRAGAYSAAAAGELMDVLGAGTPQVVTGTADALSFPGTVVINSPNSTGDACTLAKPIAGAQPAGDDGKICEIWTATAYPHTVTTPANGVNLSKHIITFTAGIGQNVRLQAWNGTWMAMGSPKGATIS